MMIASIQREDIILTNAMGRKNSKGYSIKIKNIKFGIESDYANINVEEVSPGEEQIVNGTINYPCAKIKFSKKISYLIIINEEINEIFHEVQDNLIR